MRTTFAGLRADHRRIRVTVQLNVENVESDCCGTYQEGDGALVRQPRCNRRLLDLVSWLGTRRAKKTVAFTFMTPLTPIEMKKLSLMTLVRKQNIKI